MKVALRSTKAVRARKKRLREKVERERRKGSGREEEREGVRERGRDKERGNLLFLSPAI